MLDKRTHRHFALRCKHADFSAITDFCRHSTCKFDNSKTQTMSYYFTIGRGPCSEADTTIHPGYGLKHLPAFDTYVARIEDGAVAELLDMGTREIDGKEIGDYQGARALAMPDQRFLFAPFKHCKSLEELKSAVVTHVASQSASSLLQLKTPLETKLTACTYAPHNYDTPLEDDTSEPAQAHVAVTFVNELEGSLRLPNSFTSALHQQLEVNDLREELLSFFEQNVPDATRAQLLETMSNNTRLTLRLWVMPQGQEHGDLILWQSGPLSQFLDAAYVANHDRRLYLEARLAPDVGARMRKDQYLALSGPDTTDDSEGDDFDIGYLISDDGFSSGTSSGCTPISNVSTSRIECATQVEFLPPIQRDEQPSCSVLVNIDTSNLPDVNDKPSLRLIYRIPLEASPSDLSTRVLRHACEHFRKSQNGMMLALKEVGKGLHMRSFTTFNDERDFYLNRDQNQRSRIAKLSDLFLSRKSLRSSPEIPIIIKIDIIALDPNAENFDTADFDNQSKHFAYHRVGTTPVRTSPVKRFKSKTHALPTLGPEEDVQLKPLEFAHVVRYPRSWPPGGPVVGIPCREINGVLIGDTRHADEDPDREGIVWVEKYKSIENEARRSVAIIGNLFKEMNKSGIRDGVPISPSLTFLPYVGKGVKQSAECIHVAVTLVNALKDSKIAVPMGVSMKVRDGHGTKKVICKALSGKLKEFYTSRKSHAGMRMMDEEGKWRWDLWVLPQKVVSKAQMVMYRFREESLGQFLDDSMVERTLYMEAHMIASM